MQACGCRGPAGSWSTWPAGRPGRAWGGLQRPRRYAAHCPRQPRPEVGCCCRRQGCRGARSWLVTAATRSQVWAHRSSSTGPEGRAYTLTGCLVYWEEERIGKGRCSWGAVQSERSNWTAGAELWGLLTRQVNRFYTVEAGDWVKNMWHQACRTIFRSARSGLMFQLCVFWSHLLLLDRLLSQNQVSHVTRPRKAWP